jgi:transcriptional regulator with XRE-family HTH domain
VEENLPIVRDPLNPRLSLWHWLSYHLRYLREQHGLSLSQAGTIINAARSTVSNIEAGRLRIDDDQARKLDHQYGTGQLLQLILYFASIGHDPEWFRQYTKYESIASVIKIYNVQYIPLPFQTEAYIRALLAESYLDLETEVALRKARQAAILDRTDKPCVWLLLEHAAIEYAFGTAELMAEQLTHLLKLSERPNVSVRIVPKNAGAHPGQDGPFRLFTMEARDVAYAGAQRGGRLIETPAEVRALALDYDRIGQRAHSDQESRHLIEQALEAHRNDRRVA